MKNETKLADLTIFKEKEASSYLGISRETLRKNLRYKNLIPFVRIARSIRYLKADLDAYIKAHRVEVAN
jgi:excisionase family DNA binding protein